VHFQRTTTRRRPRAALATSLALAAVFAGLLPPTSAGATPANAADASRLAREAAQELTVVDEQVHEATITVAAQQDAAAAAAVQAAAAQAALSVFEPQLRAIAQSGYTGKSQSRVAAFLTSDSADELVQQMTTLDMIAHHTNGVVAEVAAAQAVANQAQAEADAAAATAQAGLDQLRAQQAEVKKKVADYQATFARLTAAEQATVTAALAGPALRTPSVGSLPPAPGPAAAVAVRTALAQVGDPYVWASSGPDGFDCSGLTSYAYSAAGVALPHSSRSQSALGVDVARADLQPGDLVFFYSPISHVGIYIGNGMMVHARTFGQPVAVTTVDQRGYRFAKRVV
jgi:cell wall-associated NlpC family hydrolase